MTPAISGWSPALAALPNDHARAFVLLLARGLDAREAAGLIRVPPLGKREISRAVAAVEILDLAEQQALWDLIDPAIRRTVDAREAALTDTARRFTGDSDQNKLMVRVAVKRGLNPSAVAAECARVLRSV
jgi:hypothetical protein